MNKIVTHIIEGNSFYAIEHRGDDSYEELVAINVRLKKGELEMISKYHTDTFEDLAAAVDKRSKVHLVLNNNQVLQKTIPYNNESIELLIRNSYPTINFEDFYYEVCLSKDKAMIFICRKSLVDALIGLYKKKDVIVTSWSLGVASFGQLLPFMDAREREIKIPSYVLTIKEGFIADVVSTSDFEDQTYHIGGEPVLGSFLVTFGGIIRAYLRYDTSSTSNFQNEIESQDKLFKQYRFFQKGLPVAIGILLIVFLINFLFYNHYYNEVDRLQQVSQTHDAQRVLLVEKDSIVSQKKKRFDDVISSASSSVSLYVDKMMISLPQSVVLSSLTYQPIKRKIREKKEIEYENNVVRITGSTKMVDDISSWISEIEQLEFVGNTFLEIESAGSTKNFELKIKLVEI